MIGSVQGQPARARPSASGVHVLVLVEPLPFPFDTRVRAHVEALLSAGHEVTVICPAGFGFDALQETIDGVSVRRFRMPDGGRSAIGYLREYGLAMLRMARLVRRVRRERFVDVCLVCNPPDLLVALTLLLRRSGTRVLLDFREISPELYEAKFGAQGLLHRLLLANERFAFRHSDIVITVSEPCVAIARDRGKIEPTRIFLVGNGPDARRIYPVAPRPDLRCGRAHLVLWLGSMSQQEGLGRLLKAADHLVNTLGRDDVSFAMIGPGDVHEELRREIARLGLQDVVALSGAVGDDLVRAYMATASVCVGVDERNAMNDRAAMRKILEYMAMGRAVVQFPLQEMRRLCGHATLYACDANALHLAEQIARVLDDEQLRVKLETAARDRVSNGLMWHHQVPRLLAAVDAALTDAPPRPEAPKRVLSRSGSRAG